MSVYNQTVEKKHFQQPEVQTGTQNVKMEVQRLLSDNPTIWVFGYGSLLWKPDFCYKSKQIGFIEGFERRFFQGNVTFRGIPGQPGRVANLVESEGSKTWGVAYEICGQEDVSKVLNALYAREATSGGYVPMVITFYPRHYHNDDSSSGAWSRSSSDASLSSSQSDASLDGQDTRTEPFVESESSSSVSDGQSSENQSREQKKGTASEEASQENNQDSTKRSMFYMSDSDGDSDAEPEVHAQQKQDERESHQPQLPVNPSKPLPVQVLLYTATPDNDLYLGEDDVSVMAKQIVNARGSAGSNVEYVTKIADYIRTYIPEDDDTHLFALDSKVREEVYKLHAKGIPWIPIGFAEQPLDGMVEPVMAS